jgi:phosphoglycerate dehydrogenase-like enzyme
LPNQLGGADFLIVAVPRTPETHGWIQADSLGQLKSGAYLIDVSRGGVVVPEDLARSLESGRLGGAVLDVFDQEPLSIDSPFWGLPNVIVTPHVAGTSDKFMARALAVFANNLDSLKIHGRPSTPIDPEAGY